MKTYPTGLLEAGNVAHLVSILRGSEVVRFNDTDQDIVVGSDTWTAEPGANLTTFEFHIDGTPSNGEVTINARSGGPISDVDIAFGRYEGFPIQISLVDPANVGNGVGSKFVGVVGEVKSNLTGLITITARGNLTNLRAEKSETYGPMCRANLGDDRCKVPLFPPDIIRSHSYPLIGLSPVVGSVRVRGVSTGDPSDYQNLYWDLTTPGVTSSSQPGGYNGASVGDVVTDGTAQFTARNSFVRYAIVDQILGPQSFSVTSLPDSRASVDGYFVLGSAIIRGTSRYADLPMVVRKWTASTLRVDSFYIVRGLLQSGDKIEIHRGCAKTKADCQFFGAIKRRRAEDFVPGRDAVMAQA
jgi:hypothetical protein